MTDQASAEQWLYQHLGLDPAPREGDGVDLGGTRYVMERGILRQRAEGSADQRQTGESFSFKWSKRDTYESETSLTAVRDWLLARYGDVKRFLPAQPNPLVLDAGCGAAMSAIELFGQSLASLRYVGVDVSDAVDVARRRFADLGHGAAFLQADLTRLPFRPDTFDVIFSEGVLHHTDSTELALKAVARLLKPGGWILFYVYKKKAPLREFTDDYIRAQLQGLSPDKAWDMLMPLTKLGKALGELDRELDVPEDIALLGIPAGKLPVQRFVYWNIFKAYYRPEMTLDEMNHVNFDWYAPKNAHRQTPEEVSGWCAEAGLEIGDMVVEEAGMTVIARKTGTAEH